MLNDVAPLDRRDALSNVIVKCEIAKLSHTRKSIGIDVQERSRRDWIKLCERKSRTGNFSLRSKRSYKLLNKRRLSTCQRPLSKIESPGT